MDYELYVENRLHMQRIKDAKCIMLTAVAVLMTFHIFLMNFCEFRVVGDSMNDTCKSGDRYIATRYTGNAQRGDVLVIYGENNQTYIKRLIGMPGEDVSIIDGTVYVDGNELCESYITNNDTFSGEFHVPENQYFVLGDNRGNSVDSRYWEYSYIPEENVRGVVVCKVSPNIRPVIRPEYF